MPFPPASSFAKPADPANVQGLQGLVLLAVEDSRLACDALRLMCQRCGARLRRAEGLASARAHLSVYRPDVVLVDLGLPDGRGETLIRSLAADGQGRTSPVVIAMSGDPDGRVTALAAGAAGFIEKPIAGLIAFQNAILALLPDGGARRPIHSASVAVADPLALHDDLARAAAALIAAPGPEQRAYLSGFLTGIARQTVDTPLGVASALLREPGASVDAVARLLKDRLDAGKPFSPLP